MLYSLGNKYPHYLYDSEQDIVITRHYRKRNEVIVTELKWLVINTKKEPYRRVTLFEHGNPNFVSAKQIYKMVEKSSKHEISTASLEKKEKKLEQIKNADTLEEKLEKTMKLGEGEDEMKAFFEGRENKPLRRDAFIKKFGWDLLSSELLKEEKLNGAKFYSLK